ACVLLVAERDHAQACALHLAREIGDWNARQAEYRVDAIELQGFDHEIEAVRFLRRRFSRHLLAGRDVLRRLHARRRRFLACDYRIPTTSFTYSCSRSRAAAPATSCPSDFSRATRPPVFRTQHV